MRLIGGGGTTLRSPVYNLIPVDLRTPPVVSLEPLLSSGDEPLLSPSIPTLLLFECVLAYMTPSASNALIQWFVDYFGSPAGGGLLGAVVYEMFKLGDAFGRVMLTNLKVRSLSISFPPLPHGSSFELMPGAVPRRNSPRRGGAPRYCLSLAQVSRSGLHFRACVDVA